ncbi:MAG: c-type cytochrome [Acidimicrobiia bacterium]|nr:c-type cytochrome [Acidimicrobiia bacterium]
MHDKLNQIAEETGVPADLLERAARARAEKHGVAVEALVSGWAGGEAPAAAPAATAAPAEPPTPAATAEDSGAGKLPEALLRRSAAAKAKREGRPLDEVLVEMGLAPEGAGDAPAPTPEAAAPAAAATPTADTEEEPAAAESEEEEPAEEPEALFAGFPRWLAASFIIIPMIALLYAGLVPNGPDCGTSGQLAINPLNGEAEACDGGASPFFTLGEAIYEAQCVACHGANGGGGVGPAFAGGAILQTFSACTDHVEWVAIGTNDWPLATYGDNAKPAGGGGVMPGYQGSLTATEIAAVSLYERVAFGGEDVIAAETACGLVEGATAAEE